MKKISAVIAVALVISSFGFSLSISGEEIQNEVFVEHDYITGEDRFFTLDDVIRSTPENGSVKEYVSENGDRYTLPYDVPEFAD